MEFCRNCLKKNEPPVKAHIEVPAGICPVCFIRYGKYIPVCRKGSEL